MRSNRIIAFLLVLLMVASLCPVSVFAASDIYKLTAAGDVTLDGTSAKTVDVYFRSIAAQETYSLEANWSLKETEDSAYLSLTSLTAPSGASATENSASTGRVYWTDTTWSAPVVTDADGVVWTATYTVAANTPSGTYTVSLTGKATDSTFATNSFGTLTATINVTNDTSAPAEEFGITVNSSDNGTVEADKAEAAEGETVTLTVTPDEGYRLKSLTYTPAVAEGQEAAQPVTIEGSTFPMPAANVTIDAEFEAIPAGYNVSMGADQIGEQAKAAGETISIPVTVGYQAGTNEATTPTSFNSFELKFSYDNTKMELKNQSAADNDFHVADENGTVTIRRFGDAINVNGTAVELQFTAKQVGTHTVTLTAAKVGNSQNAQDLDIPDAEILDDDTQIEVKGYNVNLDEAFDGDTTVDPAEDYTFTAKDENYNYEVIASYVDADGESHNLEVKDNGDGTFTIAAGQIEGNVTISCEKEGKKFDVNITGNGAAQMVPVGEGVVTGADAAQYMTDYAVKLTSKGEGYSYEVKIEIGTDDAAVEYVTEPVDGVYTIQGKDITGDITITVTETEPTVEDHNVTFRGSGIEDVTSEKENQKVAHNGIYSFNLKMDETYEYSIGAVMGGTATMAVTKAETANEDGSYTYTVAGITADLVITIEKSDLQVTVKEYVAMSGGSEGAADKMAYLVTATQTLADGKTLGYLTGTDAEGNPSISAMYIKEFTEEATGENASQTVQKYLYLVIMEKAAEGEDASFNAEIAKQNIAVIDATSTELKKTFNVNQSPSTDINDAQLVHDMYNAMYSDFGTVSMEKYLLADVNDDNTLNVQDASAIVTFIVTPTA